MSLPDTHVVIIPSFNPGRKLSETEKGVLGVGARVIVVDDASTDGSAEPLAAWAVHEPRLDVLRLAVNQGKGGAVLAAAEWALRQGRDHALVMDADGPHPIGQVVEVLEASLRKPGALIVGKPVFGAEAPKVRLYGRQLSVGLVKLEAGRQAIEDPLFGFRVYPLRALVEVMSRTRWARRYDFDPEVAVRLVWAGVATENRPARCRYLSSAEGGVSHFHYFRDNVRMVFLHTRLLTQWLGWEVWRGLRRQACPRKTGEV